jgi:hypothetical protein
MWFDGIWQLKPTQHFGSESVWDKSITSQQSNVEIMTSMC